MRTSFEIENTHGRPSRSARKTEKDLFPPFFGTTNSTNIFDGNNRRSSAVSTTHAKIYDVAKKQTATVKCEDTPAEAFSQLDSCDLFEEVKSIQPPASDDSSFAFDVSSQMEEDPEDVVNFDNIMPENIDYKKLSPTAMSPYPVHSGKFLKNMGNIKT